MTQREINGIADALRVGQASEHLARLMLATLTGLCPRLSMARANAFLARAGVTVPAIVRDTMARMVHDPSRSA